MSRSISSISIFFIHRNYDIIVIMNNFNIAFLPTNKAAELLNLSPRTLERWRLEGRGPVYKKLGSRVVYSISDLIGWTDKQNYNSTAEYN